MAITIGLEAHDGTGKSKTAESLAKLFNGHVRESGGPFKAERDVLIEKRHSGNLSIEMLDKQITNTYLRESAVIADLIEKTPHQIVILDRTWASHAAEQIEDCRENDVEFEHFGDSNEIIYPVGVLEPALTFELKIHESTRNQRVEGRGEVLSKRDIRLREDEMYRGNLERTRKRLGCIRLLLRERSEEVAALRAAQVLLGSKKTPPLRVHQ
jgi:thymidylate kinase